MEDLHKPVPEHAIPRATSTLICTFSSASVHRTFSPGELTQMSSHLNQQKGNA